MRTLEEIEKRYVAFALKTNKWNKSKTAKQLGMSRPRLDRKIKLFDLKK